MVQKRDEEPRLPKGPPPLTEGPDGVIHLVLGESNDGCPICVAHPDGVVTQEHLRTCDCPMCSQAREQVRD